MGFLGDLRKDLSRKSGHAQNTGVSTKAGTDQETEDDIASMSFLNKPLEEEEEVNVLFQNVTYTKTAEDEETEVVKKEWTSYRNDYFQGEIRPAASEGLNAPEGAGQEKVIVVPEEEQVLVDEYVPEDQITPADRIVPADRIIPADQQTAAADRIVPAEQPVGEQLAADGQAVSEKQLLAQEADYSSAVPEEIFGTVYADEGRGDDKTGGQYQYTADIPSPGVDGGAADLGAETEDMKLVMAPEPAAAAGFAEDVFRTGKEKGSAEGVYNTGTAVKEDTIEEIKEDTKVRTREDIREDIEVIRKDIEEDTEKGTKAGREEVLKVIPEQIAVDEKAYGAGSGRAYSIDKAAENLAIMMEDLEMDAEVLTKEDVDAIGVEIPELEEGDPTEESGAVTEGMTVRGDIVSYGSLDVIGNVIGNINLRGKLNISGTIKGNSKASEIFADSAKITGEVISTGAVKVGQDSVILGNITASSAVIAGAVKGNIDVHGPVILDTSAIVMGDIKSKSVQINNGAVIEGNCSQVYAEVSPTSFFEDIVKSLEKQKK